MLWNGMKASEIQCAADASASLHGTSRINLVPEEWDFRAIEPTELRAALDYEGAREHSELSRALDLLTPELRKEFASLTREQWDERYIEIRRREGLQPGGKNYFPGLVQMLHACWCCSQFPKPWMALSLSQRATAVARHGQPHGPMRILSSEELRRIEESKRMFREMIHSDSQTQPSRCRYIIEIDWAQGDDTVLKPLLLNLLKLRPAGIRPKKRHTGKRAALEMHKLRQLAAWRLAKRAGLNYKEAPQAVEDRRTHCPSDDPYTLLPAYASPGAWKDAVDAGAKLVKRGA
jgi:hypothetical protein